MLAMQNVVNILLYIWFKLLCGDSNGGYTCIAFKLPIEVIAGERYRMCLLVFGEVLGEIVHLNSSLSSPLRSCV